MYRVGTQVSYGANSGSWPVDAIDPASYGQVFTTPRTSSRAALLTGDTSRVLLGIGSPAPARPASRGYRASLRAVHAGDRVSITLTNGEVAPFTVAGISDNQFPLSDGDAYITAAEAQQADPGQQPTRPPPSTSSTDSGADASQVVSG